jgi:hypothetical protein
MTHAATCRRAVQDVSGKPPARPANRCLYMSHSDDAEPEDIPRP